MKTLFACLFVCLVCIVVIATAVCGVAPVGELATSTPGETS
jgi:hypothetical protein